MNELLLYTTQGCHLCEQAEQLLQPVLVHINASQRARGLSELQLRPVEIAEAAELVDAYGVRIPVIRLQDDSAELGWPFDQAQAFAFLMQQLA